MSSSTDNTSNSFTMDATALAAYSKQLQSLAPDNDTTNDDNDDGDGGGATTPRSLP